MMPILSPCKNLYWLGGWRSQFRFFCYTRRASKANERSAVLRTLGTGGGAGFIFAIPCGNPAHNSIGLSFKDLNGHSVIHVDFHLWHRDRCSSAVLWHFYLPFKSFGPTGTLSKGSDIITQTLVGL